jgi:hypothetical protein
LRATRGRTEFSHAHGVCGLQSFSLFSSAQRRHGRKVTAEEEEAAEAEAEEAAAEATEAEEPEAEEMEAAEMEAEAAETEAAAARHHARLAPQPALRSSDMAVPRCLPATRAVACP